MPEDGFIDYYELMQISPNAEAETIQRVYRLLASRYHPDNPRTGDNERFLKLKSAYHVLSRREARAAYDLEYELRRTQPMSVFGMKEFAAGIDGEANRRLGILCLLYNRRRSNPDQPGMSILEFESTMSFPREHLMFTLWYLKDAELSRQDETTRFVITTKGVDHVEKNLSANQIFYNLLKTAETGDIERNPADAEGSESAGA